MTLTRYAHPLVAGLGVRLRFSFLYLPPQEALIPSITLIAVNVVGEHQADGLTQLHLSVKSFASAQACASFAVLDLLTGETVEKALSHERKRTWQLHRVLGTDQ